MTLIDWIGSVCVCGWLIYVIFEIWYLVHWENDNNGS